MPGRPTVICHGDLAVMLVIDIEWVVHCICMQTHCLHSSQRQFIKQFYKGKQISIDKPYHTYRYIYRVKKYWNISVWLNNPYYTGLALNVSEPSLNVVNHTHTLVLTSIKLYIYTQRYNYNN